LTPAYGVAGAGSKLCLEKELYFCLESDYNFLGEFTAVGKLLCIWKIICLCFCCFPADVLLAYLIQRNARELRSCLSDQVDGTVF